MAETILDRIFEHKRTEVARQQLKVPLERIKEQAAEAPAPRDFSAALRNAPNLALIAEVKKASPSKGVLIENFQPTALAEIYAKHGAAAISVLTDTRFFQGHLSYVRIIRQHLQERGWETPLLRKDFLFDPYQVYEARAYGADALLLIAAMLDDDQLQPLLDLTHELGMTALLEVHTPAEMQRVLATNAQVIGINNRNLHTFTVDLHTTSTVLNSIPPMGDTQKPIIVSESGIDTQSDLTLLREWGVHAILVGESIVRADDQAKKVQYLSGGGL